MAYVLLGANTNTATSNNAMPGNSQPYFNQAVQGERRRPEDGRVTFLVDSAYAINMATGRTIPKGRQTNAKPRTRNETARRVTRAHPYKRGADVWRRRRERQLPHTGVRGIEAADKLAALGAKIEDGHRMIERYSAEPTPQPKEHKDNAWMVSE